MGTSRSRGWKAKLAVWLVVGVVAAVEESRASGLFEECCILRCPTPSVIPNLSTQSLPLRAQAVQGNADNFLPRRRFVAECTYVPKRHVTRWRDGAPAPEAALTAFLPPDQIESFGRYDIVTISPNDHRREGWLRVPVLGGHTK